jgi:hypothetical protein
LHPGRRWVIAAGRGVPCQSHVVIAGQRGCWICLLYPAAGLRTAGSVEMLRTWVRRAEVDGGIRPGASSKESAAGFDGRDQLPEPVTGDFLER